MKMTARVLAMLLLVTLVAGGAFASGQADAPEDETVVLRMLVRPDEGGNVQRYAERFTAETGIDVLVDFVGWNEIYNKTISTLAAGGGGYDIVFIPSANVVEFSSVGTFAPLDDMIPASERSDWLEAVVDLYTREGNLIAMPWYSGGAHMVYNRAVLDAAGVDAEEIQTWAQFEEASRRVMETDLVEYAYTPSAKYPGNLYYAWGSIVASGGESFFDSSGRPVFQNGSAAVNALRMLQRGTDEGLFDPAAVAMDDYEALIQFGSGDTAFMMNSTWSATQAYRNEDLSTITGDVGYMLIPGWNDQPRSGGFLYAGGLGILESSTHKEEAQQFLRLLTGEEAQRHHAIEGANLPTRVTLFDDAEIASAWAGYEMLTAQIAYGSFLPQFSWFEEWRQVAAGAVQRTITGDVTPDDAVERMVESARSLR